MKKQRVLVLGAGGTICGRFENDGLVFDEEAAREFVKKSGVADNYEMRFHVLFLKNSTEVSDGDRQELTERVAQADFQKVVILFGTNPDSVAKTVQALREANLEGKTVVLVGSNQPFGVYYSDAPMRFGMALGILAVGAPGVYTTLDY